MKPKWTFCLLLSCCFISALAQDKIITLKGDTIDCRIISVSFDVIQFEKPEAEFIRNSIRTNQVQAYYKSVDRTNQDKPGSIPVSLDKRWRFSLNYGIGYTFLNVDDEKQILQQNGMSSVKADDFCRNLKLGSVYGGSVHYLYSWGGIGIKYSGYSTSAHSRLIIDIGDQLNYIDTGFEERIYVNSVGASFLTQQWLNWAKTLKFGTDVTLGYARYRMEREFDKNYYQLNNYLETGNNFGGNIDLWLEWFPIEKLSIIFNAGCFGAWFGKVTVTEGANKQKVKLKDYNLPVRTALRLHTSVGICFYL